METNVVLALGCLAATRAGAGCEIAKGRNRAMAQAQGCGGKSIIEMIWDRLLETYGEVLAYGDKAIRQPLTSDEADGWLETRGECLGLATALAILINPYRPNVDAIREECVERWTAQGR